MEIEFILLWYLQKKLLWYLHHWFTDKDIAMLYIQYFTLLKMIGNMFINFPRDGDTYRSIPRPNLTAKFNFNKQMWANYVLNKFKMYFWKKIIVLQCRVFLREKKCRKRFVYAWFLTGTDRTLWLALKVMSPLFNAFSGPALEIFCGVVLDYHKQILPYSV